MNARFLAVPVVLAGMWLVPAAKAASESPSVERGQHIATAMTHCTGCHGADLGGERTFPAPGGGTVVAGNLTSGGGGAGAVYSDADYVRAIRQGLRPDGATLAVMPWQDFAVLTDGDAASLVAYIRSLPPVDRSFPNVEKTVTPAVAGLPVATYRVPAAVVYPAPGTAGEYLAQLGGCLNCHGADLHGATLRGVTAPDISHGGLGAWTAGQFTTTMRTGRKPNGDLLAPPMPWREIGRLSDAELDVLYHYLEAAPGRAASGSSG